MTDFIYSHYLPIYYSIALGLSALLCASYASSQNNDNLLRKHSPSMIIIVCALLVIVLSLRRAEADSFAYAWSYTHDFNSFSTFDWHTEWAWASLAYFCRSVLHLPVSGYFAVIAAGYIGCTFWACYRLLRENPYMAMMFCLSSFSFCGYGINTLRNGFACSLLLLAFSFWIEKKKLIVFVGLLILAFGCHRSTALPIAAFLASVFVVKKPKQAIIIWFLSLAVSIALPSFLSRYSAVLGMDDRISEYMALSGKQSVYKAGFRWDFMIYSFMPILLTWYIDVKQKIVDKKFTILAITYILANAVWLQFIRVPYTDRFAYLSWFMFPVVLAYGTIRVPIWQDQDRRAAGILFLQLSFTFFMEYVR